MLIGDAAHAMNPHASQGRMQAMVDAMALADLLPSCLNDRNYSAERLKEFERARSLFEYCALWTGPSGCRVVSMLHG